MGRAQFLDMSRSRWAQFLDMPRSSVLATCSGRVAVFRHAQVLSVDVRTAVDSCSKFTPPSSKAVLERTCTPRAILSFMFIDVSVIDVGCNVSSPSARSGNRRPGMAKWRGFAQSSSCIPYQFWESVPGLAKGSSICRRESQFVDTLHRLQLASRDSPSPQRGLSWLHFCYPGCNYRYVWP